MKSKLRSNCWKIVPEGDTPRLALGTAEMMMHSLNLPASENTGWTWYRLSFLFIVSNTIVMQVAHVTYMMRHITEVEKMADTCSTVSTTFQGIVKIISLYFHSKDIRKMCKIVYKYFWPTIIFNKIIQDSVNKLARLSRRLMLSFYALIFFCCSLLLIPPLYLGIRELPLASIYPFQWQISPLYEIMYVWQWIVNLYAVCFVVGTHDFLFIISMINLIVQFRLLQHALMKIGTNDEEKMYQNLLQLSQDNVKERYETDKLLIICVEHHIILLKYADIVEKIFSPIVLSQFVESVSGLCLGIFLINLVDGVNFLKLVFFVIGHLAQLLLYCLVGNEVMYQSVKVADAAFDCSWHKFFCPKVRSGLRMIIQRAQRSKKITALRMADLNILSFIEVLRSSISFSTLFKTMIEKQNKAKNNF